MKLAEKLHSPGLNRVIGSHDALGALLGERAGFEGVWASSFEISAANGVPDAEILSMQNFLDAAAAMVSAVKIPVIADCDSGFGNAVNVIHMVKCYEAAGIAAVCIEDKQFPKVNSFLPKPQKLAEIVEFAGKIEAAIDARRSSDFLVIARVEALIAGEDLEEALRRAHAYSDAGADAILIHDKSPTPANIIEVCRRWDINKPLIVIPTTYYSITASELAELGVKMVIYANQGLRARVRILEETFAEILRTGSTASLEHRLATMEAIFDLQGVAKYERDERIYVRSSERNLPSAPIKTVTGSLLNLPNGTGGTDLQNEV